MIAWWNSMTLLQQVFATVGIAATLLLVVQVVMMMIGTVAGGGDADSGPDGGGVDVEMEPGPEGFGLAEADGMDLPDGEIGVLPEADGFDLPEGEATPGLHPGPGHHTPVYAPSSLRLFTLQGVVSFGAVAGWSGLAMMKGGAHTAVAVVLAVVFGFFTMVLMALLMRSMARLQEDGSFDIRSCFGRTATVYLPVYPHRSQPGKVSVQLTDRYLELDAVADVDHRIPTGTQVTVVGIVDKNTLLVID